MVRYRAGAGDASECWDLVAHNFNLSTQEASQTGLYEFSISLIYIEFKGSQGYILRPCSQKHFYFAFHFSGMTVLFTA